MPNNKSAHPCINLDSLEEGKAAMRWIIEQAIESEPNPVKKREYQEIHHQRWGRTNLTNEETAQLEHQFLKDFFRMGLHVRSREMGADLIQQEADEKVRAQTKQQNRAEKQRANREKQLAQSAITKQRAAAAKAAEHALVEKRKMQEAAANRLAQQERKAAEEARQTAAFERVKAAKDATATALQRQAIKDALSAELQAITEAKEAANVGGPAFDYQRMWDWIDQAEAINLGNRDSAHWATERAALAREVADEKAKAAVIASFVHEKSTQVAPSGRGKGRGGRGGHVLAVPLSEPPPEPVDTPEDKQCILCYTNVKTHLCVPCGHMCYCATCYASAGAPSQCPICRTGVAQVIQLFN